MDELQLLSSLGTLISILIAIASFYIARQKEAVTSKEELNQKFADAKTDYIQRIQDLSNRRDDKLEKAIKDRDERMDELVAERDLKLDALEKRIAGECSDKFHLLDKRLESIELKIDPLWDAIIKEIPKLLINPHTPQLDSLLRKGINQGWECLEPYEMNLLDELIDKEMAVLTLSKLTKSGEPSKRVNNKTSARLAAFAVVKAAAKMQNKLAKC